MYEDKVKRRINAVCRRRDRGLIRQRAGHRCGKAHLRRLMPSKATHRHHSAHELRTQTHARNAER